MLKHSLQLSSRQRACCTFRMSDQRTIRIFISSPADVRPERLKAEQIVTRLEREFAYHFHVEAVLWEREPLVAAHHFQDPENIPQPRGTDIVVVICGRGWGCCCRLTAFAGQSRASRSAVSATAPRFSSASTSSIRSRRSWAAGSAAPTAPA